MKNHIKTMSSFRTVAMPLSMVLLAVCVARFPVAAEPPAGMALNYTAPPSALLTRHSANCAS